MSEESKEEKKNIALEYLKRLDRGEDFFDLFADDAHVWAPYDSPNGKHSVAKGEDQYKQLFENLAKMVEEIEHNHAYFNTVVDGDTVIVEGTSKGKLDSEPWTERWEESRFVDVFKIRNGKIQRLYIYLDPDYSAY